MAAARGVPGSGPALSSGCVHETSRRAVGSCLNTQTMNRLDRLTSILIQLQSKRLTTAREIAERFEVTNRTIYRDIQTLRLSGVPIGEEEGKGYFLVEGYRLPPVMFTIEEARALATTIKILNYHTEDSLKQNYESALFKIKAVLSLKDKDKLEFLNSRIGFQKPWAPASLYLDNIQHSITENEKLKIKYQSNKEEQITERIIQPYAVYFSGAVWTTIAFCELRQEIREFRLDRIKELKFQQTHFKPDKSFRIEDYLEERSKRLF
jgi:predicted DNA-binding transcriptional regulator YafY